MIAGAVSACAPHLVLESYSAVGGEELRGRHHQWTGVLPSILARLAPVCAFFVALCLGKDYEYPVMEIIC